MPLSGHAPGAAVIGVTVAFTAMAIVTTGLRLWARLAVSRNAGWDDILITFSTVFSIATTITMIIQVEEGMGRHQDTIKPHEGIAMLKAFYVSIWVYNLSLSCSKISILLQYLRIFPQRPFRIACYTLLGVVVIYSLYTFFTAIFACTPIAYFWDDSLDGKCLNRFAIWFANSGINIGTDILTAVLPLPMLKQLELPRRQRRALMIVFGLGGFTCIVSILRLQSLYVISQSDDVSWDNPLAAIWSSVEANTAILCSCLPTLRCIFPRLLRSQLSLSGLSHTDRNNTATPKLFPTMKNKIVSSVTATGAGPPSYNEELDERSLEELNFGGGGPGCKRQKSGKRQQQHVRQKSSKHGRRDRALDDVIEMERGPNPFAGGIHVTTAIEQEVERKDANGDDTSSTGELVKRKEYDAV